MTEKTMKQGRESLLLEYDDFPGMVAFSTKRGEVVNKDQPYSSFNANPFCGDREEDVVESQQYLAEVLGITREKLVIPHQVHGTEVLVVDDNYLLQQDAGKFEMLEGVDAVVTDRSGVCVCVSTADCVPLLVCDKRLGCIAAIHAGWRGTVQNIVGKTLSVMSESFGCEARDCQVLIGPSISLDSFEVGDEVYDKFAETGFDMAKIARRYPSVKDEGGMRWHIDLWEANCRLLQQCGIERKRINIAGICTFTHHEEFFSARRLGVNSGRIFSGIMLK
jgi:YfiH family protein